MFCSYSSFKNMENSRFTAKELKLVLKKGSKTLPHIRLYKEIIRRDFRNQFEFFNQKVTLCTKVAGNLLSQLKASPNSGTSTPQLSSAPYKLSDTLIEVTKIKGGGVTQPRRLF